MKYKQSTEKTSAAKMKNKFRQSEKWKNFRFEKSIEQDGKDYLTKRPLRKGWNLHHADLHPEHYQILESDRFFALNPQTHDFIHWFYNYYKKDTQIIYRLQDIMERMKELSEAPVELAQPSLED